MCGHGLFGFLLQQAAPTFIGQEEITPRVSDDVNCVTEDSDELCLTRSIVEYCPHARGRPGQQHHALHTITDTKTVASLSK